MNTHKAVYAGKEVWSFWSWVSSRERVSSTEEVYRGTCLLPGYRQTIVQCMELIALTAERVRERRQTCKDEVVCWNVGEDRFHDLRGM